MTYVPYPAYMKPKSKITDDGETGTDVESRKADTEAGQSEAPEDFEAEVDEEFNLPVTVALIILSLYMTAGAILFTLWERWDFTNSFYFVFISMSTVGKSGLNIFRIFRFQLLHLESISCASGRQIPLKCQSIPGFGDLVPEHPIFMMATFIYLLFGLALTSMCINVVQEKLSAIFQKAKMQLGTTIGSSIQELFMSAKVLKLIQVDTELDPLIRSATQPTKVELRNSILSKYTGMPNIAITQFVATSPRLRDYLGALQR